MTRRGMPSMNRREFLKASAAGAAAFSIFGPGGPRPVRAAETKTAVALIRTSDRAQGVREALKLLSFASPKGRKVLLKPNFNTADPAPGSTHNDILRAFVLELQGRGAASVTLGESSGPPPTAQVMEAKGIPALAKDLGFDILNFEDLGPEGWVHLQPAGSSWPAGFDVARPVAEADYCATTCCLKTHRWGTFTMSLKLAVGTTPKPIRRDLHRSPDIRKMIAELNLGYKPQVIVMDGVEAFVDGGPSTGKKVEAGVVIAGTDRVAVDAVGLAVLKQLGSNEAVMGRKIFEQDQIARAVELGIGVRGPEAIEIVTADAGGGAYADLVRPILKQG